MKNATKTIVCISFILFVIVVWYYASTDYNYNIQYRGLDISNDWIIRYCNTQQCIDGTTGTISFPSFFTPGLLHNFTSIQGYVVLTKKIIIPASWKDQTLILALGKIGDADKTFFNNHFTGQTGIFPPHELSQWNKDRYYLLQPNIIHYGSVNTITIIISCMAYNRIVGDMYIAPISHNEFTTINHISSLRSSIPLYLNIGIGLTFLFIFLLLCYSRVERPKYITFILQMIPGIFVIAEPSLSATWYPDTFFRVRVFAIAWSLLVFFHFLFLHRIYNYTRKRIELLLLLITVMLIILIIHAKTIPQIEWTGLTVILILTPLAIYNLSLHGEQLVKKNEFATLFFPIGVILAITAVHDGIVYLSLFTFTIYSFFGYSFTSPIFQYTSLFVFVGAGLIIVYQYIAMSREIENMNIILEQKVEERTKELRASIENLSKAIEFGVFSVKSKLPYYFSPQLKPKIKQAIIYIHNNYRSDISREGLAALVNIHHDYFSKAFKYYTGKSVNDYIYELRVKEAIKLLLERKMNILDIALYIGFDSVKTFNRAFKKFTGKNPSDYRK